MSDYHRNKVLRVPFDKVGLNPNDYDDVGYDLWKKFGDMFYWNGSSTGKFDIAPTEEFFIDFVLESEYGADCGEWGKVRELTEVEMALYEPVFKKLYDNINMRDVRLVEYCWYNCSEAPGYYSMDKGKDPFYKEIPLICAFPLD